MKFVDRDRVDRLDKLVVFTQLLFEAFISNLLADAGRNEFTMNWAVESFCVDHCGSVCGRLGINCGDNDVECVRVIVLCITANVDLLLDQFDQKFNVLHGIQRLQVGCEEVGEVFSVYVIVMDVLKPSDVCFWSVVRGRGVLMDAHVLLLGKWHHFLLQYMEFSAADNGVNKDQAGIAVYKSFKEGSSGEGLVDSVFSAWTVVCSIFCVTVLSDKIGQGVLLNHCSQ